VLIDLGQVLAAFEDCLVVVGGWVPDLLLAVADEPHVGSIDVDLALDAAKLASGRCAQLLETLLKTRRYKQAGEPFRLFTCTTGNHP
jgi:tRNA nucleotidyltransferase/poly(A) polymerase